MSRCLHRGVGVFLIALGLVGPGESAAAVGGEPSEARLVEAREDIRLLAGLGVRWDRPWAPNKQLADFDPSEPLTVADWCLLVEGAADVAESLTEETIDEFLASRGMGPENISDAAKASRKSDDEVRAAVRRHVAILQQAEDWGAEHVSVTDAEVDQLIEDVHRQLELEGVLLYSDALLPLVGEPAESELETLFRERRAAEVEDVDALDSSMYFVPFRVSVEYVTLRAADVAGKLEAEGHDVSADEVDDCGDDPDSCSAPQTSCGPAGAVETGNQIMLDLLGELREPWAQAESGLDGYAVAPDQVRSMAYLKDVAAEYSRRYEVPIEVTSTGPLTYREAGELAGIGQARWRKSSRTVATFPAVVFRVQGIGPKPPQASDEWASALYEPTGVLVERANDETVVAWHVIRMVSVACPETATTLADVRRRVEADWRRIKALEMTRRRAEELMATARQVGLAQAWDAADAMQREFSDRAVRLSQPPFSRRQLLEPEQFEVLRIATTRTALEGVPKDAAFVGRCFDLADQLEREAVTTPMRALVGLVPLAGDAGWAVVQIVKIYDPPSEIPADYRAELAKRLRIEEFYRSVRTWFSPQEIRQRAAARG